MRGFGYHGSLCYMVSSRHQSRANSSRYCQRVTWPGFVSGWMDNCRVGPGAAFPDRVLGCGGVLCSKPRSSIPHAQAGSFRHRVWGCGVPGDVLGGHAALKVSPRTLFDFQHLCRDCDTHDLRGSPNLAGRVPLFKRSLIGAISPFVSRCVAHRYHGERQRMNRMRPEEVARRAQREH